MRLLVRLAASALLVLAPGAAAPAHAAATAGVSLVLPSVAPMLPGQQGWVSAIWHANADVCDFQATITGPRLTITYPANTGAYTSFYTASALAADNLDYTAMNIAVPATVTAPVTLTVSVSYRNLPAGQIKKSDDLKVKKFTCSGPKGSQTVTASLPVTPSTGAAVVQKTTAVSVPQSSPTWTNITFRGARPNLGAFRVTLDPPNGLTVVYPGDGTSAGLHGGVGLAVAQDDYVAVRLDASGLAPGTYTVPVHATYTGGTFSGSLTLTVT